MKYTGRVTVSFTAFSSFIYLHLFHQLPLQQSFLEGLSLLFFISVGWFLGKQYDTALYLAEHDFLTHTYNRQYANKIFPRLMRNADRQSHPLGVFLIDLDHFKTLNDAFGHEVGDLVLVEIAAEIQSIIRKEDVLIRWGGDEFLLFIPNVSKEGANRIKDRIDACLHQASSPYEELNVPLGLSLGYAIYPEQGNSFQHLVQLADKKMYRQKQKRK
jgi:diguanylate cyclase (GGDEF)-like protein